MSKLTVHLYQSQLHGSFTDTLVHYSSYLTYIQNKRW